MAYLNKSMEKSALPFPALVGRGQSQEAWPVSRGAWPVSSHAQKAQSLPGVQWTRTFPGINLLAHFMCKLMLSFFSFSTVPFTLFQKLLVQISKTFLLYNRFTLFQISI